MAIESSKEAERISEGSSKSGGPVLLFGEFRYDPRDKLLFRGQDEVPLPPRARLVLHLLLRNAGAPVSKESLLESIWSDAHVTEASLSEAVARLRESLGDDPQDPRFVRTLHRRGYQFIGRVRPEREIRSRSRWGRFFAAGLGLLLAGTLAAWYLSAPFRSADSTLPVRFTVEPPEGEVVSPKGQPVLAMSRDGRKLVFTSQRDGTPRLALKELDRPEPRPLPGTEGALAPFFSPDSEWVAYFAERKLRKLSLTDFTRVELSPAAAPHGGTWLDEGRIVFSSEGRLWSVPAEGGEAETIETAGAPVEYRWPEAIPGSPLLLVTLWKGSLENAEIALLSLPDGVERPLAAGAFGKPMPGSRIVYARPGRILSRKLHEAGAGTVLLDGVLTDPFTGAAQFAIGERALAYLPGQASVAAPSVLRWADRDGLQTTLPHESAPMKNARLSLEGQRVALTIVAGGAMDVFQGSSERPGLSRITSDGRSTGSVWTPDGKRLTFARREQDRFQVFWARIDGSEPPELLVGGNFDAFPTSWSRDGRLLTLDVLEEDTGWDIFVLSLEGEPALQSVARSRFQERSPRISPDGRWIAYQSDETGRNEVYLRGLATSGPKVRVSSGGGEWPLWSPRGDELYFHRGGTLLGAPVSTRNGLEVAGPRPVLETGGAQVEDVAPDGRFLLIEPDGSPSSLRPHVVLGWEAFE